MDVGKVIEVNGKPNISVWNDEYCDTFRGTDGTIFHPFFAKEESIITYSSDICRSLEMYPTDYRTTILGKYVINLSGDEK